MSLQLQLSSTPSGTDFPAMNKTGAGDIPAGKYVGIDASNAISSSADPGAICVKLPASDGDPVVGITMETLVDGGQATKVRFFGPIAKATASGGITAGNYVMAEGTTGKAKATTSAKASGGMAMTTASDGDDVLIMLGGAKNA